MENPNNSRGATGGQFPVLGSQKNLPTARFTEN